MSRSLRSLLALAAFFWVCALARPISAQTYNPKAIHFEGSPGLDSADLLQLSGLHEGVPLTKAEIEAGLQKLADTGSFTTLSYVVNDSALIIKLTTAGGAQMLPVRFTNFVWWRPEELERTVEARVPLYHGELTLTGSLTEPVKTALVALALEKGLHVTVDADRLSDPVTRQQTIAFSIERPSIRLGTLHIDAVRPAFGPSTDDFIGGLRGQDFDSTLTAFTITHDGADIFHNAGFLDAVVDPPVFSAPRPDGPNYTIDASATVHRGQLYRITALQLTAAPPLSESDLRKISDLKSGDPASPMGLLISSQRIARAYQNKGFLAADARTSSTLDNVGHTAAYAISVTPGALFHLALLDASAMPEALQSTLAHDSRLAPGSVADAHLFGAIQQDCSKATGHFVSINRSLDRAAHTVTLVIQSGVTPHIPDNPQPLSDRKPMLRPTALRTAALLPFLAISALAQYSISRIAIQGAAPYTEAEVLQVSGLQPGQMPLPASSLAPASFANLVWWTPAELDAAPRQHVPFYRGGIPPAGNLSDSVNAALTAMLASKGIHATVSNTPVQPTDEHPQLTWQFGIDDPSVRLTAVHLTGAPPTFSAAMQRAVDHVTYSPYNEGLSGQTINDLLLAPLRNAGYLDAKLTNTSRTVVQASAGYTAAFQAAADPLTHLVDLTINFIRTGR